MLSAEMIVLNKVADRFKAVSTNDMIEISHLEEAWKQNQEDRKEIRYTYAFELTQI